MPDASASHGGRGSREPRRAAATLYAGTRPPTSGQRWRPLEGDIDVLLLRNQPNHVIEGIGAAGMLLGETQVELRAKYGEPAYRDLASPETLVYTQETFNGAFVLRNGRITEIRLEVEKYKSPSLNFFTPHGLHETDLKGKTAAEAFSYLARLYKTRRLRQVGETVDVYGRGIRFRFRGRAVIRVEVYVPVDYYKDE